MLYRASQAFGKDEHPRPAFLQQQQGNDVTGARASRKDITDKTTAILACSATAVFDSLQFFFIFFFSPGVRLLAPQGTCDAPRFTIDGRSFFASRAKTSAYSATGKPEIPLRTDKQISVFAMPLDCTCYGKATQKKKKETMLQ